MIKLRKTNITENRLILLYMLQKVGVAIFEDAFSNLMMAYDWMTYFEMRECLISLSENGYIIIKNTDATRNYSITAGGMQILDLFKKRIPLSIRTIVDKFAKEEQSKNERTANVYSDYSQDSKNEFPVKLRIEEYGKCIFSMSIVAPTANHAKTICDKFESQAANIYANLIKTLTMDEI